MIERFAQSIEEDVRAKYPLVLSHPWSARFWSIVCGAVIDARTYPKENIVAARKVITQKYGN